MPNFHRYYIPKAVIFITAVTSDRMPYLESKADIEIYWETLKSVRQIHPFNFLAYVILPDHFHWLMRIHDSEGNFSKILHSFKRNFTINYKKTHSISSPIKIWQSRFWDHVIRNEQDLNRHFDYIHWNPVKHRVALRPDEWPQSSFSHWYKRGYYPNQWKYEEQSDIFPGEEITR